MMRPKANHHNHIKILKQHRLRLRLEFNFITLSLKLFTIEKSSLCYYASINYDDLCPPFSQIFSNLQELFNQFKLANQDNFTVDSGRYELKYCIRHSSQTYQFCISLKKMLIDRLEQVEVQNFALLKKQEQLEESLQQKRRQLQEYMLKSNQDKELGKQIVISNQFSQKKNESSSQTSIKQLEIPIKSQFLAPYKDDIQQFLQTIKARFPCRKVIFAVYRLQQALRDSQSSQMETQNEDQNILKIQDRSQLWLDECCQIPAALRTNDEKKIAQSFIHYGYGQRVLDQFINDQSISTTRYNNIVTTIMKYTFKAIQLAAKLLNEPIAYVGAQQQKLLRAPLVNCEKWLPKEELETFYSFIKKACGIEEIRVSAQSTCKLYKQIIKHLRLRQTEDQFCKVGNRKILNFKTQIPYIKRRKYLK